MLLEVTFDIETGFQRINFYGADNNIQLIEKSDLPVNSN